MSNSTLCINILNHVFFCPWWEALSYISKHWPVSESRSSSPHQTQTPSHRILGRSLHPGHLSAHKCNSFSCVSDKCVHVCTCFGCQKVSKWQLNSPPLHWSLGNTSVQHQTEQTSASSTAGKQQIQQRKVLSQAYSVTSRTKFAFVAVFLSLKTDSDFTKSDRRDRNGASRPAVPLHCCPVWTSIPSWSSGGQAAKQRVHTVTVLV